MSQHIIRPYSLRLHIQKPIHTSFIDAFSSTSMVCFSFGVFTVRLIFLVVSWPSAILEQRDDSLLRARSELGGVLSLIRYKRQFYGKQLKSMPCKCSCRTPPTLAIIRDISSECHTPLKLCGAVLHKRCRIPKRKLLVMQTRIRIFSRCWLWSHSLFTSFHSVLYFISHEKATIHGYVVHTTITDHEYLSQSSF